ncbi:unnamed protein product [Debaryomyces fabryi]|nr:unnamed protein product [Debaryomyces fabryi]
MVDCMLIAVPADLLVMLLSITTSSLGVAVLTSQTMTIALLLFIIGGYISGVSLLIKILFRLNLTPLFLIFQLIAHIFQIVTGIIFCINIIHDRLDFSKGFRGWEVTLPTIFIINVFFMAISLVLHLIVFLQGGPEEIEDFDLEKDAVSLSDSFLESQITHAHPIQEDNLPQNLNIEDQKVSKKISDQTLVEGPIYDTVVKNKLNINTNNDSAYFMDYPPNDDTSDYLYYTNKNWMDSNTNLNSLKLSTNFTNIPIPETPTKSLAKKTSFGLFRMSPRAIDSNSKLANDKQNMISGLKQSKSVPNFVKTTNLDHYRSANNKKSKFEPIPDLNTLDINKLNQNCSQVITPVNYTHDQNFGFKSDESNTNRYRRVSLIESNCNDILHGENNSPIDGSRYLVKRSKSTSYIGGKSRKTNKEERRKSIHDEKIFLRNVNESLLPAVLKSGESPIMELKRQQETLGKKTEEQNKSPLSHKGSPKHSSNLQKDLVSGLSTVGEADLSDVEKANSNEATDTEYSNLPFISEFDEPIDQERFKGFDQDIAVVEEEPVEIFKKTPKKKGTYQFNEFNYRKETTNQSGQEKEDEQTPEDYYKSLNGLEKIPKSSSTSNIIWKQESKENETSSSMNHISLKDWDSNSTKWNEHRTRSGANLNIAGITRLVSDQNLRSMSDGSNSVIPADIDLLPPLEYRLDNIDNLSDIYSTTGSTKGTELNRSFTSLNRSSSAPSLHTYREPYTGIDGTHSDSRESKSLSIKSLEDTLHHVNTIAERHTVSTASSSPIKKFFQESPKRLNVIFKRKPMTSRYSLDLSSLKDPNINSNHKHTSSLASNQFSMYSTKSSKSSSPRKSFRALLRSPSKLQTPSPIEPTFAEESNATSQNNLFNTNDDGCLIYMTENALSFWDLDTAHSSDRSRVSSIPSAVIGEYDREKWRTLKALQNQEKVSLERVEA